jgi:hypothetical protein
MHASDSTSRRTESYDPGESDPSWSFYSKIAKCRTVNGWELVLRTRDDGGCEFDGQDLPGITADCPHDQGGDYN